MNIKCLIIDDEPLAIQLIEDYISKTYFLELGCSTTNPIEGLRKVEEEKFDLIFLDIQMPELNGIDFLKILNNKANVILTTAYSDFALESYDYGVIDYLLKPISYERFYKSILKAREKFSQIFFQEDSNIENNFFFVKCDGKRIKVHFSDILYIEGLRDYVNVKTLTDELIILENLKDLEKVVPHHFMRIHKSYIVNLQRITSVVGSKIFIENQAINIGETYKNSFQNWLKSQ